MKTATILMLCLFAVGCASLVSYQVVDRYVPSAQISPLPTQSVMKTIEITGDRRETGAEKTLRIQKVPGTGSTTSKIVDDIKQQLFKVTMAFSLPYSANIDDEINAEFVISPNSDEEQTVNELEDSSGQVVTDKIDVSRTVTTRLIAPSFKVYPEGDIKQALSLNDPTKWNWVLTPTEEGEHTIRLEVIAHVMIEGERVERKLQTYKQDLNIIITPKQKISNFINEYLEFIVGTFVLPFIAWLVHFIRSRKKKKK